MTWGATITTQRSRTAEPPPGHRRHIGADRPRLVHQPRPRSATVTGSGTSSAQIDPEVARATFLARNRPAFYAASECERLPAHLREQA